jgi:putative cell wall-binding protein
MAVAGVMTVSAAIVVAAPASASGSTYASWSVSGTAPSLTGTMQAVGTPLPAATFTSNSSSLSTPTSATLGTGTPFGARFGSSSGKQYLSFRAAAGQAPSITTFTFASATPALGWGFAFGDIDAETIKVEATGPGGALTAAQLGWQGAFNYRGQADLPLWNPTTQTLSGNGADTDGASGWFIPNAPIETLTITFTNIVGFPTAQMWVAADVAPATATISGTVTDIGSTPAAASAGNTIQLFDAAANLVASTVTDADGDYILGPVTRANYSVKIIPVAGRAVVGPAVKTANASSGNVTGVDFTVAEPPAPTTIAITAPSTAIVDEAVAVTGRVSVSASATVAALTGSVAVSGLGSGCTTTTFTPVTGQTNLFSFSCVVTPRTPGSFRVTAAFSNSTTPLPPFGSSATSSLVQVLTEPPVPLIPNERVGGADRVGTAVAISKKFFAGGADIVYIATDFDFADALVAGPPAGLDSAPVLLTAPNELPASVAAEIRRLRPTEIVIVGGTRAVSSRVQSQLTPLASAVTRIGGVDRYATAALLSRERISGTGGTAYIATGLRYPDAVSAGVPAASIGAPILLVAGDTVPAVTTQELERRRTNSAVVVGGTAAVGAEAFQQLRAVVTNVERISGADRYATSAAVARRGPQTPGAVFLVTGENFPDALAAVPAAIVGGNAMLLTRKTCLPATISTELRRLQPGLVYVIGGSAAITNAVRTYTVCS